MNTEATKSVIDTLVNNLDSIPRLISSGVDKLEVIRRNTDLDFVDDGLNLLAIISIIIAAVALIIETVTWFGITGTKQSIIDEAEKNRVDKECQYRLFQDIIRHLYRNRVCTVTMEIKTLMEAQNDGIEPADGVNVYKYYYPSEEHILKLKLLPSDIHLEEYYRDANTYHRLHNMELLLRNYNVEIDSAFIHIPDADIPDKTKMRDYDTLNFKTSFLTMKIVELMDVMWPEKDNLYEAQTLIFESQQNNFSSNSKYMMTGEERSKYEKKINERISGKKMEDDMYLTKIFLSDADKEKFIEGLKNDLLIECGCNNRKEEKIHIIKRISKE